MDHKPALDKRGSVKPKHKTEKAADARAGRESGPNSSAPIPTITNDKPNHHCPYKRSPGASDEKFVRGNHPRGQNIDHNKKQMASLDHLSLRSRDRGSSSSSPRSSQGKCNDGQPVVTDTPLPGSLSPCPPCLHTSNAFSLPRKISAGVADFNNGSNSQNNFQQQQKHQTHQPTNVEKRKQQGSTAPDEDHRASKKIREHITALPSSNIEKAIEFVEHVATLTYEQNAKTNSNLVICRFDLNQMVFRVVRLLDAQQTFRSAGKPGHVDVGYHFTHSTSLASIQSNGLLSRNERNAIGVAANRFNGEVYGAGIYTSPDFSPFHGKYGDIGIIVARLKGECSVYPNGRYYESSNNSITKLFPNGQEHLTVLQTTAQCLPLMYFSASMVVPFSARHCGTLALMNFHEALQGVIDVHFNDSAPTPVSFYTKPEKLEYVGPASLAPVLLDSLSWIVKVGTYSDLCRSCPVCLDPLMSCSDHGRVVQLHACCHRFHSNCIQDVFRHSTRGPFCPTCKTTLAEPQGTMPSGTMAISYSLNNISDDEPSGSIIIRYNIPAGTQKDYHPNPGKPYSSTDRVAYLPSSDAGKDLLLRLKYAFSKGLTFTVGTSLTTGRPNSVTWTSIHHKTSMCGGVHGFPDPNYFSDCNAELDALGVPPAQKL